MSSWFGDAVVGGVVVAVEVHPPALQDGLEDLQVLPQVGQRLVELDAHGFDGGPVAGADAQPEAAGGKLGHYLRLLRHHQRVPRVGGDDGCSQLDALGQPGGGGEGRHAVGPRPAGGHPGGMDAQLLRPQNHCLYLADSRAADCDAYQLIGHNCHSFSITIRISCPCSEQNATGFR